jgi:hypothetical protein
MKKATGAILILIFTAVSFMASKGISAAGEETAGYGEEAAGYGEETGGYGEDAAGYGVEQTFVPEISAQKAPSTAAKDRPGSLDELILWYDSSSCQECHEEIYAAWEKSPHAKPLMGINNMVFMRPVLKKGHLAVKNPRDATRRNFPCFKCHLPQAMNVPDSVYAEITRAIFRNDKEKIGKLNIGCLVCHNETAITHRLLYGNPESGVVYGTQDFPEHEHDIYTTVKKSAILKRSIMCGQCHGLGPNLEFENPVQCATLFGSYLHSYIPGGGHKTCQECHMKDGDHSFPPDFNRKQETAVRLSQSIKLDVETLGYQFLTPERKYVSVAAVHTRIMNEAGHRIPDG